MAFSKRGQQWQSVDLYYFIINIIRHRRLEDLFFSPDKYSNRCTCLSPSAAAAYRRISARTRRRMSLTIADVLLHYTSIHTHRRWHNNNNNNIIYQWYDKYTAVIVKLSLILQSVFIFVNTIIIML